MTELSLSFLTATEWKIVSLFLFVQPLTDPGRAFGTFIRKRIRGAMQRPKDTG
jgi:hypothetical protein